MPIVDTPPTEYSVGGLLLYCFLSNYGIIIVNKKLMSLRMKFFRGDCMIILGHRGIPALIKENTLESLLKAIELGADGIETDVRLTKDGVPVLMHDDNLSNFCDDDIKIKELTISELKEFRYDGMTVPTLEEFLLSVPPKKCLNLEIKEYEAGEITIDLGKRYEGNVIYSSFNHDLITKLKNKYTDCKFGYLFGEAHMEMSIEEIIYLLKHNTYSAHLPIRGYLLKPEIFNNLLSMLREMGIKIVFWTVNSKDEIAQIDEYIDYLITDDVRIFKQIK